MKNCCICDNLLLIPIFSARLGDSSKSEGLLICRRCRLRLQEIRHGRNIEENIEYLNEFSPSTENEIIKVIDHRKNPKQIAIPFISVSDQEDI